MKRYTVTARFEDPKRDRTCDFSVRQNAENAYSSYVRLGDCRVTFWEDGWPVATHGTFPGALPIDFDICK